MTKRCQKFKRMKGDFYATPVKATLPLLPHLQKETMFAEFCAGDGALIDALESFGHKCVFASDIEPKREGITKLDIFLVDVDSLRKQGAIPITNPPWSRPLLHPIIEKLSATGPAWFLFDADWAHTIQATPFLEYCEKIVSVGRVSWMGNGVSGLDNAAWYLFDRTKPGNREFVGRASVNRK